MRILSLISLGLAALALAAGTASAAGKSGFFKTSNGRIYCAWGYGSGTPGGGFVVCGIKNGKLNPKPKNNCAKQGVDYVGNRIAFAATGKAKVQACAGDAGPFANPKATKVLAPGKTWKGGGMSCTVTKPTATCRNKSRHGFTITTPGPYQLF
jgi:hypothetical protein